MAIFIEISSSFGVFDCWIEKTNTEKPLYAVEIKHRSEKTDEDKPAPIRHSFFNMQTDDSGVPRVVSHSQYPLNIYWKEIEQALGDFLSSKN